jgi:hypothetical protein
MKCKADPDQSGAILVRLSHSENAPLPASTHWTFRLDLLPCAVSVRAPTEIAW